MIDLNTHPLPDLLRVGLTAEEAGLVIQWRPFSSWDALLQVLEVDAARIVALREAGAGLTDGGACLWPAPRPFRLSNGGPAPGGALGR